MWGQGSVCALIRKLRVWPSLGPSSYSATPAPFPWRKCRNRCYRSVNGEVHSLRCVLFFFSLNKSLVEEDRQKVLSLSITDVLRLGHTQQLKSRGLEQGLGAGPVASSRIVLIREGFRAAWTQVTQFRTAFYILACFPTERIKTTSTYLLVPW